MSRGGGIDDLYTKKVDIPIYETKGEDVSISQLCDTDKTELLINEIKSKKLDKEVEQFLIYSAYRHIVFDYSKIAEFYAGASKEVQELMEKSALVLIDYDKAIENGFVRLSKDLDGIMETEEDDE